MSQRFQCSPEDEDVHFFQVPVADTAEVEFVPYRAPDGCPLHRGSKVVRSGTYGKGDAVRQRYRCKPSDGSPSHRFTPPLPREVVHEGDRCELCTEHRGVHRGETTAARGHRSNTKLVAEGLIRLSNGESYGSVSVWARRKIGTAVIDSDENTSRQNSWRLAADWTELFSPVLWAPFETQARKRIETLLTKPGDRDPTVLIIDDVPVFSTSKSSGGVKQLFSVLGAGEVRFDQDGIRSETKLRLLRAFPTHGADAYKLLLDELDYVPDFIVADAGTGIRSALAWLKVRNPERPFVWVVSTRHVREQLKRNLATAMKGCPQFQPGRLLDDLESLRCLASMNAWTTWWDALQDAMDGQELPLSLRPNRWERDIKPSVDAGIAELENWSQVPRSTGALESILAHEVMPTIKRRGQGFGNLARTNQLLDLITMRVNGHIGSVGSIAQSLRADVREHNGYAPPVRAITDAGMHRSLLDADVLEQLVSKYKL